MPLREAAESFGGMTFTSDTAMVAAIGEALHSSSGATTLPGVKNASLETLAASYQAWIQSEIAASKASLDVDQTKLGETIMKQMTFVRICEDWDNLCSCGERKTLEHSTEQLFSLLPHLCCSVQSSSFIIIIIKSSLVFSLHYFTGAVHSLYVFVFASLKSQNFVMSHVNRIVKFLSVSVTVSSVVFVSGNITLHVSTCIDLVR